MSSIEQITIRSIELFTTPEGDVSSAAVGTLRLFVNAAGQIATKNEYNAVQAYGEGGGGGVSVPNRIDVTTAGGRAIVAGDLGNEIAYDNAAVGTFTIPTDATLGLSGVTVNSFTIYQKGTGRVDIAAGAGVLPIRFYGGFPTSSQYVTQKVKRVGANEWAVE